MKKNIGLKRKDKMKKGFTLIELLAVIIILGILMIIAIPSVTEYIQSSRKETYATNAKNYINGTRNIVNSNKMRLYDTETTYYIPTTCVPLEKGGDSPFGKFDPAYVVVTYSGDSYDYYFTGTDTTKMGIYLTYEGLLNKDSIKSGVNSIDTTIGVGERENIIKLDDSCDPDVVEPYIATSTIEEKGMLTATDGSGTDSNEKEVLLYDIFLKQNQENGKMILDNHSSTYVSSNTGIDFNVAPSNTNGKGIYVRAGTENNTYPIYYYRGEVENNNIIFADFCWKIVRTTETGGIKLIYNGIPTNGTCNNTGKASQIGENKFNNSADDNAYVGYMYGNFLTPKSCTHTDVYEHQYSCSSGGSFSLENAQANVNDSNVKSYIDSWYETNMSRYTNYLEDTIWCNDRTIVENPYDGGIAYGAGYSTYMTFYGGIERNGIEWQTYTLSPSLNCTNLNDRFTVDEILEGRPNGNGDLKYPIALLTADELTLAGSGTHGYSTSSYLYTGTSWITMTPYLGYWNSRAAIYSLNTEKLLDSQVYNNTGIRPSISLAKGVKVSGKGSTDVPYVITN